MSKELHTAAKIALGWFFLALVVILPTGLIYHFENWGRAMVFIATYALLLFFIVAFLLDRLLAARYKQKKHTDKLITKNPKDEQKQ